MKRFLISVVIILLSLTSITALAAAAADEEKWYQVEVLIFSRVTGDALQEEAWSYTDTALAEAGKTLVSPEIEQTVLGKKGWIPFQRLRNRSLTFSGAKQKIEGNNRYDVLVHTGWRQPLKSGGAVTPISINNHVLDAENAKIDAFDLNAETNEPQTAEATTVANAPDKYPFVAGNVSIKLSRYLHFAFDLYVKVDGESKFIGLNDSRRIKLNEINYFDHPLVGILARVTPLADAK